MPKLVLIETDNCVSCVSLRQEVSDLDVTVVNEMEAANKYIEQYQLEKLPALLVLDQDEKLGVCYGYQPRFILDYWLESILKERKN